MLAWHLIKERTGVNGKKIAEGNTHDPVIFVSETVVGKTNC